jgi:hypothetical protein
LAATFDLEFAIWDFGFAGLDCMGAFNKGLEVEDSGNPKSEIPNPKSV